MPALPSATPTTATPTTATPTTATPTTATPTTATPTTATPEATASVTLSQTDQSRLYTFIHRGHASARSRTRAQVLLKLGEGWNEAEICRAFDVCRNTVVRVRTRFAEGGVDAVLTDKRQERRRAALTGAQAAHLIAIACSEAPEGHDHWTLRLLAGRAVELGFVESISPETIRALLRRTSSSRGSTKSGASPRWARSS